MIDKNGKLFGKINVIDLLIILIVIAALALLGIRMLDGREVEPVGPAPSGTLQTVRVTFFGTEIPDYLPAGVSVGDAVVNYNTGDDFGRVQDFSVAEAYTNTYDQQRGDVVRLPIANRCWLTFTTEVTGYYSEEGLQVGDTVFVVGAGNYYNVGATRAYYYIKSMEPVG